MATRVIAVAATLTPNLRVVCQNSRSHGPTDATVSEARKAQQEIVRSVNDESLEARRNITLSVNDTVPQFVPHRSLETATSKRTQKHRVENA